MADFNWGRFAVRINIKASIEKLYWCWATRKGIEYWFLRLSEYKSPGGNLRAAEEFVDKGDTYKWQWYGYPDEVTELGTVLDLNGKDNFQFKFGDAGICTIKIYPEQDENIVELIQDNIPTDEKGKQIWHIGCKTGWTFYMTNMKSMLEGGTDLRNRNEKLQQMLNS
ncbi:MAG: SRPBCC domain-containing protein [Chitinophagaceae bacterium]